MKNFLTSFVYGIIGIFLINSLAPIIIEVGLPIYWTFIAAFILFSEIVVKLLLLQAVPDFIVSQTTLEEHSHLNLDTNLFNHYCQDLKAIGFEKLTDYTSPSIKGMARLFHHPEHDCYAEVGLLEGYPAFCSIVGGFEQNWFFAATNNNPSTNMKAISYAFLSLPRIMYKVFNEEPKLLLKSFLSWQSEIKSKLALETIAIADEKLYFTWEKNKREMQRQRLMRKSIVVSLIKMFLFSLHPKSEWMGDYLKYSN